MLRVWKCVEKWGVKVGGEKARARLPRRYETRGPYLTEPTG